jgi:hypothetical protein
VFKKEDKNAKEFEEAKSRAPQRMVCIREEHRGKLTKKLEASFTGLFEHPLKQEKGKL